MSDAPSLEQQVRDTWKRIPKEERTALASKAQAEAMEGCALILIMGAGGALGLHTPWIFLACAAAFPFLFQALSLRSWRQLKPRIITRYFVASETSKRYARHLWGTEPEVLILFQATITPSETPRDTLDASFTDTPEGPLPPTSVWVSVFPEHILMISEKSGGAHIEFAHSTVDNISISVEASEESPDTTRLLIETSDPDSEPVRWVVSSSYPSHLLTCHERVERLVERARKQREEEMRRKEEARQRLAHEEQKRAQMREQLLAAQRAREHQPPLLDHPIPTSNSEGAPA